MTKYLTAILFVTGFLFTGIRPAAAQDGTNDFSINVSAKVISSIEMVTLQSMNLSKAEAENGRILINPLKSSNAGKMIAIGTPNANIRISFLQQKELTRKEGSETLLFNYRVAGNSQDDQSSAEILNRENRDFKFNSDGRFFLWIGGNVDISSAIPGNYQGEFSVDIEYI
ncbi:MAG: hypothetical protein PVI44_12910 [Balneolaceae bacterium]|jgi:hypothetical protein